MILYKNNIKILYIINYLMLQYKTCYLFYRFIKIKKFSKFLRFKYRWYRIKNVFETNSSQTQSKA